jgi:hypothetical protein
VHRCSNRADPAVIANEFREATSAGVHRSALLFLALLLVLIALGMATVSRLLVRRTARLMGDDVAAQEEAASSTLGLA